ncbi:MAG: hypothetical protein JXQ71_17620 [Verrucomicrobia bacterium]|nr:hypothetical protein [Verrucomicrobiota bacterium]
MNLFRHPATLTLGLLSLGAAFRAPAAPPPAPAGRQGATLHVSKRGDNTDGRSWRTAFHRIQAALDAVPDDRGGHRILIRPDTYAEANLDSKHKGAPGAYNVIEGDWDGQLGSGAQGWVVIDSGAPLAVVRTNPKAATGNPTFMVLTGGSPEAETGLKSVDWWGPWRCDPAYSAAGWDRWVFRRLYCTGSEGGLGWDMTCEAGRAFSAMVEDCVGLGRFAGACVMGHVGRAGEPVVFRRSYFMCLDVWGDAGAVYVRAHHKTMPAAPDAVFEDCTLVGMDNALQVGYPKFEGYSRVQFKRSRLIVLNFSQPHGTPATGAVYSDLAGKFLHVEFEDCTVMGYKVLGAREGDLFSFTTRGTNRAYVQYRQPVPKGFERLRFWPVATFNELMPPRFQAPQHSQAAHTRPRLTKLPLAIGPGAMENTPVVFNGRPLLVLNRRDDTRNGTDDYTRSMHLYVRDLTTGGEVARFGEGHSFASAFVNGPELHVFASEGTNRDWFQSLHRFSTTDLKTWKRALAIPQAPGEHLFNASVCRDPQGYLMAYESDQPVKFCFKFARSADLAHWHKLDNLVFAGASGGEYSACPVIRHVAPYYYVIYLHAATPGHPGWIAFLARSKDLADWELSPFNPLLEAGPGEGINNSDVDLFEFEGNTYLFYATGDQQTWGSVRTALFAGPMRQCFESHFPPGLPTVRVSALRKLGR